MEASWYLFVLNILYEEEGERKVYILFYLDRSEVTHVSTCFQPTASMNHQTLERERGGKPNTGRWAKLVIHPGLCWTTPVTLPTTTTNNNLLSRAVNRTFLRYGGALSVYIIIIRCFYCYYYYYKTLSSSDLIPINSRWCSEKTHFWQTTTTTLVVFLLLLFRKEERGGDGEYKLRYKNHPPQGHRHRPEADRV